MTNVYSDGPRQRGLEPDPRLSVNNLSSFKRGPYVCFTNSGTIQQ